MRTKCRPFLGTDTKDGRIWRAVLIFVLGGEEDTRSGTGDAEVDGDKEPGKARTEMFGGDEDRGR